MTPMGWVPDSMGSVSPREELYRVQDGRCAGCGGEFSYEQMTVDHIVPKSRGGGGYMDGNIQLMCKWCNGAKANGTHEEFEERLALWNAHDRKCADCGASRHINKIRIVDGRVVCHREDMCRRRQSRKILRVTLLKGGRWRIAT